MTRRAAPILLLLLLAVPAGGGSPDWKLEVLPPSTSQRELALIMLDFSRGLGVGCHHCHVPGEAGQGRAEIAANRRRMRDLIDWNAKRPGKPPLTCSGCHEGKLVPDYARMPSGLGRLQELQRISGAASFGELFAAILANGTMSHGFADAEPAAGAAAARPAGATKAPPPPRGDPPPDR